MNDKIELYRPANGSEGLWFTGKFCSNCKKDAIENGTKHPDECADSDLCQILGATYLFHVQDKEYPSAWRYDDKGKPYCAAFEPVKPVEDE